MADSAEGAVAEIFEPYGDYVADCPARLAVDLFASAWLPVLVWALRNGPMRPVRLQQEVGGISQKVLTQTLRRMQRYGLVERHRYAEAPPRVEYALTGPGRDLLIPIHALGQWAHRHADTVLANEIEPESGSDDPRSCPEA
ncbi:winged helix-turn-helix transcriptional regulator [Microtetraspora malaysiensis]|uniref:winged helix-turn-helix transcriptional regulator n=1 Tax=Microtetraspora malaysiensis TaxID=161358 RepID=UPI003D9011D8